MTKQEKPGGMTAFLKKVPTDRLKQLLTDAQSELDTREPKEASEMSDSELRAEVEKQLFKPKTKKEDQTNE